MICQDCRDGNHPVCIHRNDGKCTADCDCQHRVAQKTVVLPAKLPPQEVLLPQVG